MIKSKEMAVYSCKFKQEYLNFLKEKYNLDLDNKGIKAPILMEEIYRNTLISKLNKQYIYYLIRTKHAKEFKSVRQLNLYGLGWDWFNTGYHLYNCDHIVRSDYITKSHHINFSKYVNRSNNCDHLLFCNNLSNKSYMAFNQPVEPQRFKQLKDMSLTELKKQPEFNKRLYTMLRKIHRLLKKGESHNENKNDK